MNAHILTRTVALAGLLGCLVAVPLDAQVGLLRRAQEKAREQLGGVAAGERGTPADASPAPAAEPHSAARNADPDVLTMDAALLDRFARALGAEIGTRAEWTAFEQKFIECEAGMAMSDAVREELTRLTERMSAEMEKVQTPEDMIGVGERYQAGMDALTRRQCGSDRTELSERRSGIDDRILQAALTAGGFRDHQYALLKERVIPFCVDGGRSGSVPGPGGRKFYVYSPEEVAAIAPRCETLMPQIERTI